MIGGSDSLIYLDESGTVHPGLTTEWTFSEDNLTVTYKLRPGVTFHDGTPFNAQIVQDTVKRHLDPATASPTGYMLGPLKETQVIDEMTVAYVYTEPFVPMYVVSATPTVHRSAFRQQPRRWIWPGARWHRSIQIRGMVGE